jgi:hypothetical protein
MALLVMDAPSSAQVATLDVDAAFQCVPIRPEQQRHFVVHWLKKWVDDFAIFRYPRTSNPGCGTLDYCLQDILQLAEHLGWPWKPSKTVMIYPMEHFSLIFLIFALYVS